MSSTRIATRKGDTVDAEKIARYAWVDPEILRPVSSHGGQQEALTLIRMRNLIVRLRTAAVNSVRGLAKPCSYWLRASCTLCVSPSDVWPCCRQVWLRRSARCSNRSMQ